MNRAAALAEAFRLHREGDLPGAEAGYRRVLSRRPEDVDALHLLGTVIAARGLVQEGSGLIGRALALRPVFPEALSNLGGIWLAAGDAASALECYDRAGVLAPDMAQVHHNRAVALQRLHRMPEALAAARRAAALRPGNAETWTLIGALLEQDDAAGGEAAYRRACALAPQTSDARTALGNLLYRVGRRDEAEAAHRLAVHNAPGSVNALYNLGAMLRAGGDPAQADTVLRRVLALDPGHADAWNALGTCMRSLGRFAEAADCFRRAIEIRPAHAGAWRHLALSGHKVASEAEQAALTALAGRDLPAAEAAAVEFALAKTLDEQGRPDDAFPHYAAGNALVAGAFAGTADAYDPSAFEIRLRELRSQSLPEPSPEPTRGARLGERAVLIVGMPRSGTSLVEQILASHRAVWGAGELPDLRRLMGAIGPAEAADAYLRRLEALAPGADRITDKMPDNIFELGRVAAALPAARVIFCRRDGRDIGLSCFTTHFASGNAYSYDLGQCGHRIRHTEALAEHWRRTLKLRHLTVDYEALVGDLEGQSRAMVAFLGLAWDEACMQFHQTDRPVTTASAWQVRQPLFRGSIARWRRYERHLGPLLKAL